MTPADRKSFLEIVVGLAELKGKQLSAPALELYWHAMRDWPIADFRAAAGHLLRSCEFMPTPKDFEDLRKAGRPTAGEAWLEVLDNVRGSAYRRGETCGGAIDRAVQALGGDHVVGHCDTDRLGFLERRFAEHYEAMQDADETRMRLPNIATPRIARDVQAMLPDLRS